MFEIYNGDSLAILRDMPSCSVDGVVSDPPYSSGGQFRGDRTLSTGDKYVQTGTKLDRADFAGDTRDQRSFGYWSSLWLAECLRVAKPGAPVALFIDWRQLPILTDALQAGGWVWRGVAVWDKMHARPNLGRFSQQAEFLVWGSKGAHPKLKEIGCLPGVIRCARDKESRIHQTGKPVPLMMDVCRIVPAGGVILDPFMGSGSTGVAALRGGWKFLGIEVTKEWFNVARERLESEA